ncbi:hypothetical protein CSOJ01_09065 [Colletotrichum sojae]|uniref:Uncharacterized protein n=1 Tax=Colletotrichum sojae TaxID=2175907 RepID=A0A8H6MS12_9PEZI|nr:hypothetical protein CSOJ01_09065 [Colletotrichum sojae]
MENAHLDHPERGSRRQKMTISPLWTLPWQYHHPVKPLDKPCDPSLWKDLFIRLNRSRLDELKQDFCLELDTRYSSTGPACGHQVYSLPWDMTSGGSKDVFFSSKRASVDQPSLGMSSTNEESSHFFQGSTRKELLSATPKDTSGFHVERISASLLGLLERTLWHGRRDSRHHPGVETSADDYTYQPLPSTADFGSHVCHTTITPAPWSISHVFAEPDSRAPQSWAAARRDASWAKLSLMDKVWGSAKNPGEQYRLRHLPGTG